MAHNFNNTMCELINEPYTHIIAVDFEATCWANQPPPIYRKSEIIEFPAVLFNLKTGEIEAEFHKYVKPVEAPQLSPYCINLTGITQTIADRGLVLPVAVMMFREWLSEELGKRKLILPKMSTNNLRGNCAFVTWTDWDFGICLELEFCRKGFMKPSYFNQWIDARFVYSHKYRLRPCNFADALNRVGLKFEGKQHSGIDDARNLAKLVYKIVQDGGHLALTKDLTPFKLNSSTEL